MLCCLRGDDWLVITLLIISTIITEAVNSSQRVLVQEAPIAKTGTKKSLDIFIDTGLPVQDKPMLVNKVSGEKNELQQEDGIIRNSLGPTISYKSSVSTQQEAAKQEQALEATANSAPAETPQPFNEMQQASDNSDEKNTQDTALQEALIEHNRLREAHGVPPLQWNITLAVKAQEIADGIAADPKSFTQEVPGENVAQIWHDFPLAPKKATDIWYGEVSKYSFSYPKYTDSVRHFVQMVWRSSRMMGMGFASSPAGQYMIVVALYSPVASDIHVLRKNVLRPGVVKDFYATLKHSISRPHKLQTKKSNLNALPNDL